jgi:2-polyprenyl-3-methyl-5-hydroxy-6-metoxy-1,4-benzoquinol methylase
VPENSKTKDGLHMLARRQLPPEFEKWNLKWGVPYGLHSTAMAMLNTLPASPRAGILRQRAVQRARGPFAFQPNSSTRSYEYPWTYHQLAGFGTSRILEIGGALSGLQFVLAKEGHEVHNVDPFVDYGSGEYEVNPVSEHAHLNALFSTDVTLHRATLPDARIDGSFDAVYCISTIEHLTPADIEETMTRVKQLLKPGGLLVVTLDLFLNLEPFSSRTSNEWGTNLPASWLQELTGFELVAGVREELYGYEQFSTNYLLSHLEDYAINIYYPTLAQLMTLKAPAA